MIDLLYDLGFDTDDINTILSDNNNIIDYDTIDALKVINLLKKYKCNHFQIKNIIFSNSMVLNRSCIDLESLCLFLIKIGLTDLGLIFDSNPWLLNRECYEIEEFIKEKLNSGMMFDEIIDLIDENSFIIN